MEHKEIEQIIKKYFKKLHHLLGQIEKDFDPEAIHHFRVQVKKLRALLRLLATELQDRRFQLENLLYLARVNTELQKEKMCILVGLY